LWVCLLHQAWLAPLLLLLLLQLLGVFVPVEAA
jgi:hypothetical protein